MKIALVQCPMFAIRMPLIGLAYLRAYMERYGHTIVQFDFNIELYNSLKPELKKFWDYGYNDKWTNLDSAFFTSGVLSEEIFDAWSKKILAADVDIIGFTVNFYSFKVSQLLAEKIKRLAPKKTIIFGGPAIIASVDLEIDTGRIKTIDDLIIKSLNNGVDVFVIGEGEATLREIAERLEQNNSLDGCAGIITRRKRFRRNWFRLRPLISDLEQLPFPNLSILKEHTFPGRKFLPILATRGCPNRCTFCDYPYLGLYKLRLRSAKNVVDEIEYQNNKYSPSIFHFNDSTINADMNLLSQICAMIIERKIQIRWGSSISIRRAMSRDLFFKMKQSGCEYLSFGIESAAVSVLKSMRKNFEVDDIEQNLLACYESGIAVCTNWIIGYPTETKEDFQQTLNFIQKNRKYIHEMDVNLFVVKRHTQLYDNLDEFNVHKFRVNDFSWRTNDGLNTLDIRLERLKIFKSNFPEMAEERVNIA